MPRFESVGSPAFRIYQGETVGGQAWASSAIQLTGAFRILYDDGTEDVFSIDRVACDATRKRTGLSSHRVAKTDGWVNSGSVWQVGGATNTTAAQRGACYVQVGILSGAPGDSTGIFPEIRVQLARGYCYLGHPVQLDENVEPGPTGGAGHMKHISVGATAVGGSTGLAITAVPTNAMWRFLYGLIAYVATATVGTRSVRLRFRDNSADVYLRLAAQSPTAGQTVGYEFAPNMTTIQTFLIGDLSGTADTEFPVPDRALPAAYDIFIVDSSNIDVLDTATLELEVEEWVIPGI